MSFFKKKSFKWLLILLMSFFFLIGIKNVYAPPPPPGIPIYTWSAHGNTSYGVNRSSIAAFGYSQANCAHCHEQHASIGGAEPAPVTGTERYMLFRNLFGGNQNAGFCFWCHTDPTGDTNQQQILMPKQYNYSRIAGGDTTISCPDDILETCMHLNTGCTGSRSSWCGSSLGSAHCLEDIRQYLVGTGAWNFGAQRRVNPCSGCHNPHRAQQDLHDSSRWTGQKLPGVVSRPSHHSKDNNAWQLWGDDPGERMSDNALAGGSVYQAPCRYPWSSACFTGPPPSCLQCEPDGSTTQNGLNMFDSVTFCLDCHGVGAVPGAITSTRYGALSPIDWGQTGNQHGHNSDVGVGGGGNTLNAPYPAGVMSSGSPDYVLSCVDCHEPHGSRNEYLLRQTVNGTQVSITVSGSWCLWCASCHADPHDNTPDGNPTCGGMTGCNMCHTHNQSAF